MRILLQYLQPKPASRPARRTGREMPKALHDFRLRYAEHQHRAWAAHYVDINAVLDAVVTNAVPDRPPAGPNERLRLPTSVYDEALAQQLQLDDEPRAAERRGCEDEDHDGEPPSPALALLRSEAARALAFVEGRLVQLGESVAALQLELDALALAERMAEVGGGLLPANSWKSYHPAAPFASLLGLCGGCRPL